jgi:hypothetical protein
MWLTFASACALGVVRDTSSGSEEVHSWPGPVFIDWIFDPLFLFNAAGISFFPVVGLAWLLGQGGVSLGVEAFAIWFFFFPIVMLSMLETNSPFGAVSLPVWRTLFRSARGWATFYLMSFLLLMGSALAGSAALLDISYWGGLVGGAALTFAWLVYFRLLGRLAWYCSERSADDEEDENDPEDEEIEELKLLEEK